MLCPKRVRSLASLLPCLLPQVRPCRDARIPLVRKVLPEEESAPVNEPADGVASERIIFTAVTADGNNNNIMKMKSRSNKKGKGGGGSNDDNKDALTLRVDELDHGGGAARRGGGGGARVHDGGGAALPGVGGEAPAGPLGAVAGGEGE